MSVQVSKKNAVLVLNYLKKEYPTISRKFLIDLLRKSDEAGDDFYWDEEEWRAQVLAGAGGPQTLEQLVSAAVKASPKLAPAAANKKKSTTPKASPKIAAKRAAAPAADSSSSDDEAPAQKKQRTASPKVAPKKGRPVVDDSSSDDEVPVRKSAPVAAIKKTSPAMKPKKPVVADDSSSDDDVPVRPSAAKRSPAQKPVVAKKPVADDSSSDDEIPVRKSAPVATKKPAVADSSDDEDEAPARPSAAAASRPSGGNAVPPAPANFKPRTSRIDVDAVKFHNDRLKDNAPGQEATSFLQNRKMMAVKGKEFNKHKQKNKSKLYAPPSGVDTSVRSFKFDDDDE